MSCQSHCITFTPPSDISTVNNLVPCPLKLRRMSSFCASVRFFIMPVPPLSSSFVLSKLISLISKWKYFHRYSIWVPVPECFNIVPFCQIRCHHHQDLRWSESIEENIEFLLRGGLFHGPHFFRKAFQDLGDMFLGIYFFQSLSCKYMSDVWGDIVSQIKSYCYHSLSLSFFRVWSIAPKPHRGFEPPKPTQMVNTGLWVLYGMMPPAGGLAGGYLF